MSQFPHFQAKPFMVLTWRSPHESIITSLPLDNDNHSVIPGIPARVVILAFSRCRCALINGWNTGKIRIPEADGLANFWSTSDYDEIEAVLEKEKLPFAQRMRKEWYPDDQKDKETAKVRLYCAN
jgi:hypothetical protein